MGFFDRFRATARHSGTAAPTRLEAWSGADVDWAAAGVPADRQETAADIAGSDDFGVDASDDDEFTWTVSVFDDVRGIAGDDAIEHLLAWLTEFTDIDEVVHWDRELIGVRGTVDRDTLAVRVVARLATTADPDYWNDTGADDTAT